jgi:Putative adhesin
VTTRLHPARVRGRPAWLVLGSVLTAAVVAFGGLTVWSWLAHQTLTQQQTYQHPVSRIELELESGDVSLTPGAAGQVRVSRRLGWSIARPRPVESWDGTTLRLRAGCPTVLGTDCYLDYDLRVPADVTVVARTSSGALTVRELAGALDLSASSGDVRLTGTSGPLVVRTSSGAVRASALRAPSVAVRASSGDVDLGFARPPRLVRATASAGNIGITVPRGAAYNVQADADPGSTAVTVDRLASSPYVIVAQAGSGDIHVRYGTQ